MAEKPRIFISAVTREFSSARQLVANTLTFLGFQPIWQEIFGTNQGDLLEMHRQKIESCAGLIQLTGQRFGFGPTDPAQDPAAVSYTQFELLHARERGLKVWPILFADRFPADSPNDEPEAHRQNQRRYRERLQADGQLYQTAADSAELENIILKLRHPVEELRAEWEKEQRKLRRFRPIVIAALLLLLGVGVDASS